MQPSKRTRVRRLKLSSIVVTGITAMIGGTYMVASGATGRAHPTPAYSSPESIRAISITPSGGTGVDGTNLTFNGLLPGYPQTVTLDYRNSGTTPTSVWIVFPNVTALSALNSLGQYGSVQLSSNGAGATGTVFTSTNLNDNPLACGTFSTSGCWPIKSQYLLAHVVVPGASGSFSFRFEFASAYDTQPTPGASSAWNPYPVTGQTTVVPSDGTGAGLPYQLAALEPGITPGEPDTIHQRAPFNGDVTTDESGTFVSQLMVEAPLSPASFIVTSPDSNLHVSGNGRLSVVGGPLAPGDYLIRGTDTDSQGGVGMWYFTLHVTTKSTHESPNHR